jgi:hypothetical protein
MGKIFLTVTGLIIFKARWCALNLDIALIPTATFPSENETGLSQGSSRMIRDEARIHKYTHTSQFIVLLR